MNTHTELITPSKAKNLLKNNTHNRPVSKKRVNHYSALMKDDKWHLTHQGIAIANDGTVLDGQHRLKAIIKANRPIKMNVSYEVNKDNFKYIDVGYTRTTSNIFAIENIKNYTRHASGVSRYFDFKDSFGSFGRNSRRVENNYTHNDYLVFYYDNEDFLIEVNTKTSKIYRQYSLITCSHLYALYVYSVLNAGWDIDHIHNFFENTYMLKNDSESNAPKKLFKALVKDATANKQMTQKVKLALIIKSFNYYTEGRSIKILKYDEKREGSVEMLHNE